MKASEWRARARAQAREQAVELELPSGMVILARRPDALQLATWGRLPLGLAASAAGERATVTAEEAAGLAEFMRDLLLACCVSPRISLDPRGEDEIHPRDIPEEDWRHIVRWAMRAEEARALEGFRGERSDAGAGGDGKVVRLPAVGAAGDRGPGAGAGG